MEETSLGVSLKWRSLIRILIDIIPFIVLLRFVLYPPLAIIFLIYSGMLLKWIVEGILIKYSFDGKYLEKSKYQFFANHNLVGVITQESIKVENVDETKEIGFTKIPLVSKIEIEAGDKKMIIPKYFYNKIESNIVAVKI